MDKEQKDKLLKAEIINQLERMNSNLEEIWHNLNDIQHFIQVISDSGLFNREVFESIISIARAQSREFNETYIQQENQKAKRM